MAEDGTTVQYAVKNDHGYELVDKRGKLVLEDPNTAHPWPFPWAAGSKCGYSRRL